MLRDLHGRLLRPFRQAAIARSAGQYPAALARAHRESGVAKQRLASGRRSPALSFGAGIDGDARRPPEQFPASFQHFRLRAFGIAFEEGQRVDRVVLGDPVQGRGAAADSAGGI